jgi:signal peptidase II
VDSSSVPPAAAVVDARPLPRGFSWRRWFLPTLIVTLGSDLVSKSLIFAHSDAVDWPHWIRWDFNRGVAWSAFSDQPWLVAALTAILIPILTVVWWIGYRALRIDNVAFGLILGGALGNAYDRLLTRLGHLEGVRDFIHVNLGVWPANPWPTFNIADSAICLGFALVLLVPNRWRVKPAAGAK